MQFEFSSSECPALGLGIRISGFFRISSFVLRISKDTPPPVRNIQISVARWSYRKVEVTPVGVLHTQKRLGLSGVITFGELSEVGNLFRCTKVATSGTHISPKIKTAPGRTGRAVIHTNRHRSDEFRICYRCKGRSRSKRLELYIQP